MDLPSDLIELLAEFEKEKVEYLLVGGQALALHGHPRFTEDADLWLRDTAENIANAQNALVRFGAPPQTVSAIATAAPLDVVWMGHPPSRIDLMKGVPGGDFEKAWASEMMMSCEGVTVPIVSRDELSRLKRASGRPQDLIDADALDAIH